MAHASINRDFWNSLAPEYAAYGERLWALTTPEWGIWSTPDHEAPLLPEDMAGLSAIELGCGTAYVSGWMARRGARVTGIDVSEDQLATARRLSAQHQIDVTLIQGDAEKTELPSESFDFAVSEYGAAIWCDPEVWLREAHRLLRKGGKLSFLGSHPMVIVATPENGAPAERKMHRSYRALGRIDWTEVEFEPGGIEFNRTFSDWLALFRDIGFAVTDYREIYAKEGSKDTFFVSADWAMSFPSEQVWWLKKL